VFCAFDLQSHFQINHIFYSSHSNQTLRETKIIFALDIHPNTPPLCRCL